MIALIKGFMATLSFVTCLPVLMPGSKSPRQWSERQNFSGLAKYLSSVGLLIGLLLCLVCSLLIRIDASPILSSTVLVTAWLCLSNGFHFDGLMDTADGIFSHQSVARTLEIMSDSRVGNYGVMVAVIVLGLKIASVSTLNQPAIFVPLLLCPAWARWCASFAMGNFPYVKEKGMGKIWHDSMKYPKDLVVGAIVPAGATAATLYFFPHSTMLATLATIACGMLASFWLAKKLGGHTGDTYGAIVELSELGGVLISALFLK